MNTILRSGLLNGISVLLDSATEPDGEQLGRGLRDLGARVQTLDGDALERVGEQGAIDALVIDCSGWRPGQVPAPSATEPLQRLLDRVWSLTAAVAGQAFIPGGDGGRLVLVAPADRDPVTARAAVAALENLSRTLSVEWARYRITVCTLAPSPDTRDAELGTVVGYLLSPAGGYFSGTRLDLGGLSG